jgi:hypothetical protein
VSSQKQTRQDSSGKQGYLARIKSRGRFIEAAGHIRFGSKADDLLVQLYLDAPLGKHTRAHKCVFDTGIF